MSTLEELVATLEPEQRASAERYVRALLTPRPAVRPPVDRDPDELRRITNPTVSELFGFQVLAEDRYLEMRDESIRWPGSVKPRPTRAQAAEHRRSVARDFMGIEREAGGEITWAQACRLFHAPFEGTWGPPTTDLPRPAHWDDDSLAY